MLRASLAAGLVLAAAACGSHDTAARVHTIDTTRIVDRAATDLQLGATSSERFGFASPRGRDLGADSRGNAQDEQRGLTWDTPAGWEAVASTSMRTANFRVAGDERAECYLTLLAGDAGGLASNVNRWRAQMSLPVMSAKDIEALPKFKFFGRDAAYVDFAGTWTGMSGRERGEDYRLVGLLLFSPDGSIFLKMVGPASVIAPEVEAFQALARSFRTGDGAARASAPGGETAPKAETAAPGFNWKAPTGWRRAPDRATRAVSFFISEGDEAECYVTLLAGDAGGPLANINRWRKQMGQSDISAEDMARLERIPMLASDALFVEVEGRTEQDPSAPALLLGAVCNLGERAVFVKCTGPKSVVESQRDAFKSFCSSLTANP